MKNTIINNFNITEKNLLKKIQNKKFTVGVIGLGYVGLPLSKIIANNQIKVIGFDVNTKLVKKLKLGKSPFKQILDEEIQKISKLFFPTSDFKLISQCDLIIFCLPTAVVHAATFLNDKQDVLAPN